MTQTTHATRIDDLIKQHCPDGVEFRSIYDLCTVFNGSAFKAKLFNTDGVGLPVVRIRDVNTGFSGTYYSGDYDDRWIVENGDLLIGMDGYFKAIRWSHGRALLNQRVCRLQEFKADVLPSYVFYQVQGVLDRIHSSVGGSTVKHLSSGDLSRAKIPVPPLVVQEEIVRILDTFTELEAELEARRHQYEHYSERLLATSSDVPRVRLGEVTAISRGASPRPIRKFLTGAEDGIPWIKIGDVPVSGKYITGTAQKVTSAGAAKSRLVRPGDFVLSNSMSFGRPYISAIEGCIHDGWLAISGFEHVFLPEYLYYLLRSRNVQRQFARRAGAGTVSNLNANIVRATEVPLPSLEHQQEIVSLLNSFDSILNDLSKGLPAEITARRQQYEFYRDRLLSFEELVS